MTPEKILAVAGGLGGGAHGQTAMCIGGLQLGGELGNIILPAPSVCGLL